MRSQGTVRAIGVESTGSFGATLTRSLTAAGDTSSRSTGPTVLRGADGPVDLNDVFTRRSATGSGSHRKSRCSPPRLRGLPWLRIQLSSCL